MDAYNTETKSLARTLLSLIPETLQLKPDFFEKKIGNPNQRVRMNYYPQYPKPDRSYLRPHTNMTGTTLLLQHDEILGLNIRKDDRWVAVQPIPYALVLNVGKSIEVNFL
jgi:isopenicillin N synthase-like dioxygenase